VPLVNIALLIKATILEATQPLPVLITVAITAVCAVIALKLAANAFQSEALRFGQSRSWRALLGGGASSGSKTRT
jgi:hypothetical protein